ncbi:MAG TPA: hypothetical protein VHU80_17280, partial [Polyangiaceae bacterium]|nr:hypothetical protein [Polyangiaceae bacterium]
MRNAVRFVALLILGLALVTWVASLAVRHTMHDWFVKDIGLRAELAVGGAHEALISHWNDRHRADLRQVLTEITRDERVMAASACTTDLEPLAWTDDFPTSLSCESLGSHVRPGADAPAARWA